MKRLILAALLAFALGIGNFVTVPRATTPSGCADRHGIIAGTLSRCPMPWWRQGFRILA